MKVSIYIDADGLEEVAKGQEPIYWNFGIRASGAPAPRDYVFVGEAELIFPSSDKAAAGAIAVLQKRKADAYKDAAERARELDERIQNLLALPAPEAKS